MVYKASTKPRLVIAYSFQQLQLLSMHVKPNHNSEAHNKARIDTESPTAAQSTVLILILPSYNSVSETETLRRISEENITKKHGEGNQRSGILGWLLINPDGQRFMKSKCTMNKHVETYHGKQLCLSEWKTFETTNAERPLLSLSSEGTTSELQPGST